MPEGPRQGRYAEPLSADEIRLASRSQWSGVAEGWARNVERRESGASGAAADWMLDAVAVRPGSRVLELACGAGDVGLRAAEAVGPAGRVVCSDFAEPMLEVGRERARGMRLDNVETRTLDAEDLRLAGERFDAVLCRLGYMLMADAGKAINESCVALEPGGRLALGVWGSAERNPWLSLLTDAVMKTLGAPAPEPGTPGPFALSDHDRLRDLLGAAGLEDILIEDLHADRRHDSLEEWWAGTQDLSGPIAMLLSQLTADQVEEIRAAALDGAQAYVEPDGAVRFPATVVVAAATRPGGA